MDQFGLQTLHLLFIELLVELLGLLVCLFFVLLLMVFNLLRTGYRAVKALLGLTMLLI